VRQDPSLEYGKRNSRSGMFRIVPKFKKEKLPKKSNPPSGKSVLCVCVCVCACMCVHIYLNILTSDGDYNHGYLMRFFHS